MPSDSYPFAVGRIKGLERSFLDPAEFSRIADLPEYSAVKSLADSGYGQDATDKTDPDALISAEMDTLRLTIEELTPKTALTDLFFLSQDAINLKLLLKARLLEEEVVDDELAFGLYDAELLKKAVENKDYSELPEKLAEGLDEVETAIAKKAELGVSVDPFTVSAEVDRAIYQYVFAQLKKLRNSFVSKYFKAKVDFTNVLSLLRARSLRWEKERFELVFIDGGELEKKEVLNAYDLPVDGMERAINFGSNDRAIKRGLSAYLNDNNSVFAASAIFDDALMEIAASERNDSFGIGPIIHYLLKKMDEGKRLRVLFARKRARKDMRQEAE